VGKLLMWVVIILVILIVIRIVAARNNAKRAAPPPPPSPSQGTKAESMVRCAYCGVHLPRSEATLINGKTWCDREHAKLGNH
jgi:uncharacterized protein